MLAGTGALSLDGQTHPLEPETGAYLAPGEEYELHNQGAEPLQVVSVRIEDPVAAGDTRGRG